MRRGWRGFEQRVCKIGDQGAVALLAFLQMLGPPGFLAFQVFILGCDISVAYLAAVWAGLYSQRGAGAIELSGLSTLEAAVEFICGGFLELGDADEGLLGGGAGPLADVATAGVAAALGAHG